MPKVEVVTSIPPTRGRGRPTPDWATDAKAAIDAGAKVVKISDVSVYAAGGIRAGKYGYGEGFNAVNRNTRQVDGKDVVDVYITKAAE